jgi:hypothetical protein
MNFLRTATKIFFLLFFVFSAVNFAQSIYEIPSGTKIRLRMDNEINSEVSSMNDTFTATIAEPVTIREAVVLPVGTVIEGRITRVKRAASGGQSGEMEVEFEEIRLVNGVKREIDGMLVNELKAESNSPTRNVFSIIGGAALGAIVGVISRAENGALIGAGIGAGAGTGVALLQKGKDVKIKAEEKFEIKLTKNVTLPAEDF